MELAYPLELFREDFARHVEFLRDCSVEHVPLYYTCTAPERERFFGTGTTLKETAERLHEQVGIIREAGLKIEVVYSGGALAATVLDDAPQQEEFLHVCSVAAELGLGLIGVAVPNPSREDTDEEWMEQVVGGYQWLADRAEEWGLRVCSHCGTARGRRFFAAEDLEELLDRVDRPNNGLLMCFGNAALSDPDVPAQIRRFGQRIFAVHVRQVQLSPEGAEIEAPLPHGIIDLGECLRALREVGYEGLLHPEHFPKFTTALPAEDRDLWKLDLEPDGTTLAWNLGYVRALMTEALK